MLGDRNNHVPKSCEAARPDFQTMRKTIKAFVWKSGSEPLDLVLDEAPLPQPEDGFVLVRNLPGQLAARTNRRFSGKAIIELDTTHD
jgi:hypothetical protein